MFCDAGSLKQVQKGATYQCTSKLGCRAEGPPPQYDEDNPALDGDVGDSLALINHKLLKHSGNGNVEGIRTMLGKRAFVETRRPFVMTMEATPLHQLSPLRGDGLTPLMFAAQGGYEQACQVLLNYGACVNAEDEDGMRPLHYAATAGCVDTCAVLLSRGADIGAKDDDGLTALDHVPADDMITSAEKKQWQCILGSRKVEAAATVADKGLESRHADGEEDDLAFGDRVPHDENPEVSPEQTPSLLLMN